MATTKKKPAAKKPTPGTRAPSLEIAFARAYVANGYNGTRAYLAVRPTVQPQVAAVKASGLVRNEKVKAEVAKLQAAAAKTANVNAADVIREAWHLMTADPREFAELHQRACRYCWGKDHRYQRTDGELADAESEHRLRLATADAKARAKIGPFDPQGGGGFHALLDPNGDCPACGGLGEPHVVLKDTRTLSPQALALFAGVKQTKEGVEVKTHSKDGAIDKLMRHFGLYKDRIELTMPTAIFKDMTGRKDTGE
jgi:phage terminase small subunit